MPVSNLMLFVAMLMIFGEFVVAVNNASEVQNFLTQKMVCASATPPSRGLEEGMASQPHLVHTHLSLHSGSDRMNPLPKHVENITAQKCFVLSTCSSGFVQWPSRLVSFLNRNAACAYSLRNVILNAQNDLSCFILEVHISLCSRHTPGVSTSKPMSGLHMLRPCDVIIK